MYDHPESPNEGAFPGKNKNPRTNRLSWKVLECLECSTLLDERRLRARTCSAGTPKSLLVLPREPGAFVAALATIPEDIRMHLLVLCPGA